MSGRGRSRPPMVGAGVGHPLHTAPCRRSSGLSCRATGSGPGSQSSEGHSQVSLSGGVLSSSKAHCAMKSSDKTV